MAKEQRNKRVKQREYACGSCPNMEERFKGQKEINFSGLEPGEFQKALGRLVWCVGFLVFTHCMNLKWLSPCQRFGLLGLNLYLSMYRQGWYHRWNPSYCCITMSNKNIYSAKEAFTDVFRHLIRACCCQTKMSANEQQQDSQVIQTNCYLSALQKSQYLNGHFIEDVLPLTLDHSRTGMEGCIRVCFFLPFLVIEGPPGPWWLWQDYLMFGSCELKDHTSEQDRRVKDMWAYPYHL